MKYVCGQVLSFLEVQVMKQRLINDLEEVGGICNIYLVRKGGGKEGVSCVSLDCFSK